MSWVMLPIACVIIYLACPGLFGRGRELAVVTTPEVRPPELPAAPTRKLLRAAPDGARGEGYDGRD